MVTDNPTHGHAPFCVVMLVGACLLAGCVPYYADTDAFIIAPRQSYSFKPYVIEPPDQIRIIAPAAPEINNIDQQLRPDGYITLHLIGDILAADKTPRDLAQEIEEKIKDFYQNVNIEVRVIGFNSKVYYMVGETNMGPVPYTGNDSVFDAVMRAGIPFTAWPEKAVVIRPNEVSGLVKRMSIDLKAMMETGDFRRNAVLEEGDIVFIPINPLAAIGRVFQNLLLPVQPAIAAVSTPARVADLPVP